MLNAKALLIAGFSGLLIACSASGVADKPAEDNRAAHEQAIRNTNEQWLALIRDHDAPAVSMLYTADGAMMAPGAPIAQGQPALEAAWGGLMQMPGLVLTFRLTSRDVAQCVAATADTATLSQRIRTIGEVERLTRREGCSGSSAAAFT